MRAVMIESIVYKPETPSTGPLHGFRRVPLQRATLVVGHGIYGDAKGGHPTRQLNIMCSDTLQMLRDNGYDVAPGHMGEQIIVSGVDLLALQLGDRLQMGSAIVEMTLHRTGCMRFMEYQGQDTPTDQQPGTLGIMAKVVQGGEIAVGDVVRVLSPEPPQQAP